MNASSLNKASGEIADIRIIPTAGSAVPTAAWVPSVTSTTTLLAIWTPSPIIRVITTGVNAAAWNQRNDFQNHDRPASETRPAAQIGVVTASTIKAPARVSSTSKCAIPANHNRPPSIPNTVASVASVMSSGCSSANGCHSPSESTPNKVFMRLLVSAPQAVITAAA